MKAVLLLLLAALAHAGNFQFPDSEALGDFHLAHRESDSKLYSRPNHHRDDSLTLLLESRNGSPWSATFSQNQEFEEDWILEQIPAFVPEASANPLPDPAGNSPELQAIPGLKQQWSLRGLRGVALGWMGAGVRGKRYFVVIRSQAPGTVDEGVGPLRVRFGVSNYLDTALGWLSTPCREKAPGKGKPHCYLSREDGSFQVQVQTQKPARLEIRFEKGEPLAEVRVAAESLRDEQRPEYVRDLSGLLRGEALQVLASASRKIPQAFSWPAWKLTELKAGAVPPDRYLKIWRAQGRLPDPLPAFEMRSDSLFLSVDLYFDGRSRIIAQPNP